MGQIRRDVFDAKDLIKITDEDVIASTPREAIKAMHDSFVQDRPQAVRNTEYQIVRIYHKVFGN